MPENTVHKISNSLQKIKNVKSPEDGMVGAEATKIGENALLYKAMSFFNLYIY